jgi:peptidoglycan/xylan/chitin deacetylase (PgdA/CDA1 family)
LLSIVTFHRVLPGAEREAYPYPGLVVTPEELDKLLDYFTEHFDCGTLATQHERYLDGRISERPLLALTFDDGQYDNFRHARPMLDQHGVKASFFVPVEAVQRRELVWHDRLGFAVLELLNRVDGGRERLMQIVSAAGLSGGRPGSLVENLVEESKRLTLDTRLRLVDALANESGNSRVPEFARLMTFDEIAELASDGHEIGSHSMTHCLMPECDDRSLAYELQESRCVLEARIGRSIETFCYPNGDCDARTAGAVANTGYRRAVTTRWGHNGPKADRYQLRRFHIDASHLWQSNGTFLPDVLAFRMSGYYPGLG